MKITAKNKIVEWWNRCDEKIHRATYIERYLGSNESSTVYLKVNTKPNPTTIAKIGERGMKWFETEMLPESDSINVRYYRIIRPLFPTHLNELIVP